MKTLLSLPTLVEPDRQRLARFAVEATRALGGNVFSTVSRLVPLLERLRRQAADGCTPVEVALCLAGGTLRACWGDQSLDLLTLSDVPPSQSVDNLAAWLRKASESTDPELLRRRNQQIAADLERAQRLAAAEMAELEAMLERKKEELQESIRLAETDSLTGLLNRGAYDNRLRDAVLRCARQKEDLCLILLDLDKFKEINDTYGHQYGDSYLQKMATTMSGAVRDHVDFACRMGGDEFAIIALCGVKVARRIADRILEGMERRVSIGVAQLIDGDSVDTLVGRTDAALYEAKRRGRGQVVEAPEVPMGRKAGCA